MQTYHNQGGVIRGAGQLVREYVGNLQDNTEALRSNFSGSSAPTDPAIGQKYFNVSNNITYVYNGTAWIPDGDTTATHSEVVDARGQMNDLGTRLNVSMNPDGTLKDPVTANVDEWKTPALTVTYVSENSFTVPDDMTPVFTEYRGLKLYDGTNTVITSVTSSEYSSQYNVTTVTTSDSVVSQDVETVSYSIIQDSVAIGITDTYMVKRNIEYAVDDTVTVPGLPIGMFLKCTTAGTTGVTAPVITPPVSEGETITDGTVVWTVRKCLSASAADLGYTRKTFTSSDTFTPTKTGLYCITLVGGGGGGSGSGTNYHGNHRGGAGGGCGNVNVIHAPLVAGETYSFIVGAGGTGGTAGSSSNNTGGNGGNGGTTSITIGGTTYGANGGIGGYGASGFFSDYTGGNRGDVGLLVSLGGAGALSPYYNNNTNYGMGGRGGDWDNGIYRNGGSGHQGVVVIEWLALI